jgi:transcription elongation GreA/GreB family factor
MSSAFKREQDDDVSIVDIGERPVSTHRNLVTKSGLIQIETEIATLREDLAKAEAEADREKIAIFSRDLRYWNARRENAELSEPEPDETVVRFGMVVTLEDEDGKSHVWKIVGEDEADTTHGKISHAAPLAQALFGKSVGDVVEVNDKEWTLTGLEVPDSH